MALRICEGCSARFASGLTHCPQCGGAEHHEEGTEHMPKITRHSGPSVAGATVIGGTWGDSDTADSWPETTEEKETEEVPSSPGNSSETSSKKPDNGQRTSARNRQSRATSTGPRSKKGQTDGRSADSADDSPASSDSQS